MSPISVRDGMGSTKSISALLLESSSAHSLTRSTSKREVDPHCGHSDEVLDSRCSQSRQRRPSKCAFRVTTAFSTRPALAACNTSSIPTAAKPLFSSLLLITSQRACSDVRSCSTKRSKISFAPKHRFCPSPGPYLPQPSGRFGSARLFESLVTSPWTPPSEPV